MVWTRRATAPAYADVISEIRALVSGSPDAWILPWITLLPGQRIMDVSSFCALGPPIFEPLIDADFVGNSPLSLVTLASRVSRWMETKLFEVYCEELTQGPGCVTVWEGVSVQTHSRAFEEYDEVARFDLEPWVTSVNIYETLLPGNAQNSAWPNNWKALRVRILDVGNNTVVQDTHPVNLAQFADHVTISVPTNHQQIVVDVNDNPPGNYGFRIEACGDLPGEEYVAPVQVQPDAAIAPTPGTYSTIADLGAELDEIEKKLHWVLDYTSGATLEAGALMLADEVIAVEDGDQDVALGPDVAAFIITVSNIGSGVDMHFGAPPVLHRLGRVVIGNGTAWSPPIELTVSPMLLLKTSSFQTVVRVQVAPPATATVTTLVKSLLAAE